MEVTAQSLTQTKLPNTLGCSTSLSLPFFHSKTSLLAYHSGTSLCFKSFPIHIQGIKIRARQQRSLGAIHASGSESSSTDDAERWLLEPVGDGDTRHIGFKVPMPNAFEIASSVVMVGRLPEKADMVIPVATVSGLHARIQKKKGSLLVTDLDSTNGTFIEDKRLSPGVVATVSPGTCITFGDTHLAMFRVSKLEDLEVTRKLEESEVSLETAE